MPKQLNTSEGINLMNIQYAVVFGVVFSFSFYVNSGSSAHAKFAISNENIITFICLLFYLLIDWTRANFLQEKIDFTSVSDHEIKSVIRKIRSRLIP